MSLPKDNEIAMPSREQLYPLVQSIMQEQLLLYQFPIRTKGSPQFHSRTGIPVGGRKGAGVLMSSTDSFGVFFGSSVPTLAAAQGSIYLRSDGSSGGTRMYVNTDGSTAWSSISSVVAIARSSSDVTVSNNNTEQTLVTISIPADSIGTDGWIHALIMFFNIGADGAAAGTLTIRADYGGTDILTMLTKDLSGKSAGACTLELWINAGSSASAQEGIGILSLNQIPGTFDNTHAYIDFGTSAVDSATALDLTITSQWSVADTDNTITVAGYMVTKY